ncbi:hypothetical protein BDV37DRAFT_289502 [Aspergillus pseudonomiae]|uniref:S-adenosyl-L-methionine-dependent methyltransferase n=1 Tax=Aspergillus pseudonomiae TaxID=1506151 RepID=A0A5N7CTQ8_9EURO|nr:uncharacterized protein BDV37DRAFT_289502 [Aspergillus pseudonomiae]KAE8397359.1 hypothetical protein BDV37DRAFT_289502 [Aspergillus pseudonomiae]
MDNTATDSESMIEDVFSPGSLSTTDSLSSIDMDDLPSLGVDEERGMDTVGTIQRNGREYYGEQLDRYPWPTDLEARGDMHEIALAHFDGHLFHAPIVEEPEKVLDIGTGIGAWAIDFADAFRHSTVTGIDWIYIQADLGTPNVHFVLDDFEYYPEWHNAFRNIDYVHIGQIGHRVQNLGNILDGIKRQVHDLTESEYSLTMCPDALSQEPGSSLAIGL